MGTRRPLGSEGLAKEARRVFPRDTATRLRLAGYGVAESVGRAEPKPWRRLARASPLQTTPCWQDRQGLRNIPGQAQALPTLCAFCASLRPFAPRFVIGRWVLSVGRSRPLRRPVPSRSASVALSPGMLFCCVHVQAASLVSCWILAWAVASKAAMRARPLGLFVPFCGHCLFKDVDWPHKAQEAQNG